MVSVDKIQTASGSTSANFAFSTLRITWPIWRHSRPRTPAFRQGATATSNSAAFQSREGIQLLPSPQAVSRGGGGVDRQRLTVTDSRNNVRGRDQCA